MSDLRERTSEDFGGAIKASVRKRLVRGETRSGDDIVALRTFVGPTQDKFAELSASAFTHSATGSRAGGGRRAQHSRCCGSPRGIPRSCEKPWGGGTDGPGRFPGDEGLAVSAFDRWVNDNNISTTFEYAKGWWDYIELIRRFVDHLDTEDVRVIGHYIVDTPPPCERLPMPAVAISKPGVTFALRFDFGSLSVRLGLRQGAVSVRRRSRYAGPLFGLIDEAEDLRHAGQLIGTNDLWIACTARVASVPILTRNVEHFERVPDLQVVGYVRPVPGP